MTSETTSSWNGDVTTLNFENETSLNNVTQTVVGGANTILAEETIKIIYLVIGLLNVQYFII